MTQGLFLMQMQRLSGLKFVPADYDTHWEALRELPDDVLEAAVTRAQKTRVEFPTPFELRQDADQVVHAPSEERDDPARMTALTTRKVFSYPQGGRDIVVKAEWLYDCEDCSDSGWQSVWCGNIKAPQRKPWQEPRTCDRRGSHVPHEWARKCACVDTNPTLRRRRDAQQKYAEKGGKA